MSEKSSSIGSFKNYFLKTGQNTVQSWEPAPLPYILIPVQPIQVEKVSLSDMKNLRTAS